MYCKIIGAILVMLACGGLGFKIASAQLYQEKTLRQLIGLLDYMECELQYHLTPLPQLCRQGAAEAKGILSEVFLILTQELESQISPDVQHCMDATLNKCNNLPSLTVSALDLLGHSLGRFDLNGQLKGLEAVRQQCRRDLETLNNNKDARLRGYQTLGLCAGAALVILFI